MKATELLRQRIVLAEDCFAELVLWRLPAPLAGSSHHFKYHLAYVVSQVCVLRYDNEGGKGDHWHWGAQEQHYEFSGPEQLLRELQQDISRWNRENRDTRSPAAG